MAYLYPPNRRMEHGSRENIIKALIYLPRKSQACMLLRTTGMTGTQTIKSVRRIFLCFTFGFLTAESARLDRIPVEWKLRGKWDKSHGDHTIGQSGGWPDPADTAGQYCIDSISLLLNDNIRISRLENEARK